VFLAKVTELYQLLRMIRNKLEFDSMLAKELNVFCSFFAKT